MRRFLKELIRTIIGFVVIFIAVIFTLGIAKYISAAAAFIVLLSVGFLLMLYVNFRDSE